MSDPTPRRWTRVHTIWLLIILCLLPGITAAVFRDGWEQLPAGVRGAMILVSAILAVAVVSLILSGGPGQKGQNHSRDE
jgi:uncharacterized membrane protein